MQDRPTARELLEAVAGFLRREVMDRVEGRIRFHTRVAANLLDIVARELEHERDQARAEWERLDALLGPEPRPEDPGAMRLRLQQRTGELCRRIRQGAAEEEMKRIRHHVRETVREKLVVSNPAMVAGAVEEGGREGERGAAFAVVLMALLILAFLYFGLPALRSHSGGGSDSPGLAALEQAQEAACRTSRQILQRAIPLWRARHPGEDPTIGDLVAEGFRISPCPEGGRYEIVSGRVYCTVHDPPP